MRREAHTSAHKDRLERTGFDGPMQEFSGVGKASSSSLFRVTLLCFFLLVAHASPRCLAQSSPKVATSDCRGRYLYNFGKFIRFPAAQERAATPFTICILGDEFLAERSIPSLQNESIAGRKIVARRLTSATATGGCQIVFIAQSEEPKLTQDLAVLDKRPILTVSGLDGFLERGGMIQFLVQNK